MKNFILTLLLLFIIFDISAQNKELNKYSASQLKSLAKSAHRQADTYSEIDFLHEYAKKKPADLKQLNRLAFLYYSVKNYPKAEKIYTRLYRADSLRYKTVSYYLGEIYKAYEKYDSALYYFNRCVQTSVNQHEKPIFYYISLAETESCRFALENCTNNDRIVVYHLNNGINKAHLETSPQIINDSTFIYSSFNLDSVPVYPLADSVLKPTLNFYAAHLDKNQWKPASYLPSPFFELNTESVANGCFSSDGLRFYFTVSKQNFKNQTISQIYVSQLVSGKWTRPEVPDKRLNYKGYTSTQPTLGEPFQNNLDVLYFVSDRPGGHGGMDIWYTVYNKTTDSYNKPVNAGGYINTFGNETTPFYVQETRTMYFSSDGLPGYGGFDIFKTNGSTVNWLPAENLGKPINSSYDDYYFRKLQNTESGFLVSNRTDAIALKNDHCCYDIFEFRLPEKIEILLSGNIVESDTSSLARVYRKFDTDTFSVKKRMRNSIDSTIVALRMKNTTTGNSVEISSQTLDSDSAHFQFNLEPDKTYELDIHKSYFLPKNIDVKTDSVNENSEIVLKDILIEPVPSKAIAFRNIYFDFNKSELTSESKTVIDSTILEIMKEYPEIVVEIGAHTDYIGSDEYNLELSQARAESVTDYLSSKGISPKRLKAMGYGELVPVSSALTPEGIDIPEGREKNRRIEFKLIGFLLRK
jgi:outer membrane protein OmpA-like peptidoglycan-associated protein/tetratricopeptide (TPR) repeat protein